MCIKKSLCYFLQSLSVDSRYFYLFFYITLFRPGIFPRGPQQDRGAAISYLTLSVTQKMTEHVSVLDIRQPGMLDGTFTISVGFILHRPLGKSL